MEFRCLIWMKLRMVIAKLGGLKQNLASQSSSAGLSDKTDVARIRRVDVS